MLDCTESEELKADAENARTSAVQQAVDQAIDNMREKLLSGDFKMSVGEFARLLELRKELSAENIRHVKVTWVDPLIPEPVSGI